MEDPHLYMGFYGSKMDLKKTTDTLCGMHIPPYEYLAVPVNRDHPRMEH